MQRACTPPGFSNANVKVALLEMDKSVEVGKSYAVKYHSYHKDH